MAAIPDIEEVRAEKERLEYRKRCLNALRSTVFALIIVAAVSVLLATLFFPVLRVSGSSMEPSLNDKDVIVLFSCGSCRRGDQVGFYYENKLLLKRVIAGPGDVVDIDSEGNVYVNGELLDEPYVTEKSPGGTDLSYPYQVPDGRYFVMGDNRKVSIDSRSTAIGCIEKDRIVGKIILRVWPLKRIGVIR